NSMCNLKSPTRGVQISSGPCPGLTSVPFSTFQAAFGLSLSGRHPLRSLPLNNETGFPHLGVPVRLSVGALSPVHVQGVLSGPLVLPTSRPPTSFASNCISSLRSSASLGETNVSFPCAISTLGNGRAFPHRPTICAFNWPPSSDTSSHEGYSWLGACSVRSQRPKNGLVDALDLLAPCGCA